MSQYYGVFFCLPIITMFTQPVSAGPVTPKTTIMEEVVVSESRIEESRKEVSGNISIISREDIEQSASDNLAELLTEYGLGHIQQYPGSMTSIGIRGFRTDTHGNDLQGKVLILFDGRRAGSGNAVKIMTKNVERVEIIRGPGAVQYGSAGIGGVVNVITRRGNDQSMFVETGVGSFDRAEGAVGITALSGGFDFSGTVEYQTLGDYDIGGGETFANTGVDSQIGMSLNGGYTFSKRHRLGMTLTSFDVNESGSPGYFTMNDLDDYNDKSNYSFDTQYTGSSSSGVYQWMARYFFGRDENKWVTPTDSNPDGWDSLIPSKNKTDQKGAQAQITALYNSHTITAGLDWVSYDIENTWSPEETNYSNPAFFILGKGSYLNDTLITNFGLRGDWFEVEVKDPAGRTEEQSRLTPKIGLAWLVNENLKLRAQYAEGFMMPTADQLAVDSVNWGMRVVGNPDLDPEKSNTYEGGIDYFPGNFSGSLSYFHTEFEDKIVSQYLLDGSQSWGNVGDATVAGFELELSYDFGVLLRWDWEFRPYLNATLLTDYEDDKTGEDLLYTSDVTLSAGLVVNNGMGTFFRLNVAHYSSQDVEDWLSGSYPTPVIELDSITVADLTGSYRFFESDQYGAFTVRAEVKNIFDEEYAYVNGYPMPGANFYLGLRWDY